MGRSGSSGAEPEGAELEWGRCIRYIYGWRWVRQQQGSMLMKFFVDTADLSEIRELAETGLLDGVTTNPSLIAKRSEEHTSELQSLMRISYAVFCLKKNKTPHDTYTYICHNNNT